MQRRCFPKVPGFIGTQIQQPPCMSRKQGGIRKAAGWGKIRILWLEIPGALGYHGERNVGDEGSGLRAGAWEGEGDTSHAPIAGSQTLTIEVTRVTARVMVSAGGVQGYEVRAVRGFRVPGARGTRSTRWRGHGVPGGGGAVRVARVTRGGHRKRIELRPKSTTFAIREQSIYIALSGLYCYKIETNRTR